MAKERLFNLPETKGMFQLKGIVTGTDKEKFYVEKKTKTGKDFKSVNFGLTFNEGKTMYVSMQAMPQEFVYFSKQVKKGEQKETVKVNWADRHTFKRENFKLIGNNIGVKKTVNGEGKQVNDKKTLVEFDACKEVGENLKDNQNVFTKGKIEFSSFESNNSIKKSIKFIPNQISLCGEIKFDDEKFVPAHDFTQTIVFTNIDQEKNGDVSTGRFIVSAKIVTYSTIEDAEFIITDSKLAQLFRKNLKPYTAIEVWGKLDTATQTEEIENEDEWGESNSMTKINAPTKRELVITGASKSSIDTDTYSKTLIEEALQKIRNSKNAENDYADDNSGWWSSSSLSTSTDEEDEAWD